jgi:hypothetical protein
VSAIHLQRAPEANEIGGRADMLVGHAACLGAAERKGDMTMQEFGIFHSSEISSS